MTKVFQAWGVFQIHDGLVDFSAASFVQEGARESEELVAQLLRRGREVEVAPGLHDGERRRCPSFVRISTRLMILAGNAGLKLRQCCFQGAEEGYLSGIWQPPIWK